MSDKEIVFKLIANDHRMIEYFFFVRCREALTFIGQYFFPTKLTAEELIGDFYEFLSANDWHKLRIFNYTCSLNSYVTIIASRYFQRKRDKETLSIDEHEGFVRRLVSDNVNNAFFMEDVDKILNTLHPFDRFLVQRILLEGEKPGDILHEAQEFMRKDTSIKTSATTTKEIAGYVYTRYNRAKNNIKQQMTTMGYGI